MTDGRPLRCPLPCTPRAGGWRPRCAAHRGLSPRAGSGPSRGFTGLPPGHFKPAGHQGQQRVQPWILRMGECFPVNIPQADDLVSVVQAILPTQVILPSHPPTTFSKRVPR